MAHVSDFTQAGPKIVLDLVNFDNDTPLAPSFITVERSATAPTTKNSVAVLTAQAGSGYSGTREVEYDRLDVQDFIDLRFAEGLVIQLGDAESVGDLADDLNAALGINLIVGTDIPDDAIPAWEGQPNEQKTIEVDVLESSLVYLGTFQFTLDGNDIPLDSVITTTALSGLNLPVVEG